MNQTNDMAESPSEWVEVRVLGPEEWSELIAERVAEVTGGSIAFGRSSRAADPVPDGFELVRGFYPTTRDTEALRTKLAMGLVQLAEPTEDERLARLEPWFKPLPAEDWANSWRKSWKPFRIGRLAVVTFDWGGTLRDSDVPLRLEPAGAFGTGRHPTTRRCLEWLAGQDLTGKRVLDAGCGSGILSVAARLLGADYAFGFDIDERSAPEGQALAERNGINSGLRLAHGGFELLQGVVDPYDVVLANIYADVLQDHAKTLFAALRPGGQWAFSGIHERHLDGTLEHLGSSGFENPLVRRTGRWATIISPAG